LAFNLLRSRQPLRYHGYILDKLEKLNYVYKYPEWKVSASYSCGEMLNLTLIKRSQGAFRSTLILKVYVQHLQKLRVSPITNQYGHQIGALVLATAAVC